MLVHRNASYCRIVSVGALSDFEHLVGMKIVTLMLDVLFRFHLVFISQGFACFRIEFDDLYTSIFILWLIAGLFASSRWIWLCGE